MQDGQTPSPVGVVCDGIEQTKEKRQGTFETLECLSSNLRNTTA